MEILAPLGPVEALRAGRLPRRLGQLFVGLSLYGVSLAMFVRAALGLDPWDVLHAGVARHTALSFGTVVVIVGILVLLLWIPLRQWPGLGTVSNAIWIGVVADIGLAWITSGLSLPVRIALLVGAIVLNGIASGMYIGSQLGPGPRDGLMTGFAARTGRSLRLVRTVVEVVVLAIGWLLGGSVGVGTIAYALAIGPLVQIFLPWFLVDLPRAVPTVRIDETEGM